MADFDPLTVPAVMPVTVRRITEAGFPTQSLLDYEQALQAWMKSNVANTNTRLNLVSDEVDGAYAAISTEATTRATADSALATQITTVAASVDDATANGQIFFAAKAAPSGASAAYGLFLTAGTSFAGFEALAMSAGGSAIGLTANQFVFTDSGTATAILSYSAGVWSFNSNVSINGSLVVNGTVVTEKIAANAVSNVASGSNSGGDLTVVAYARAGASVLLIGDVQTSTSTAPVTAASISLGGTVLKSATIETVKYMEAGDSGSVITRFLPVTIVHIYIASSTGSHSFALKTDNPSDTMPKSLIAQELAR